MKQIIFRLALTAFVVIALIQTGAINALFMFIVAGIIPGTNYAIPATVMTLAYCTVICAILLYVTARDIIRGLFTRYIQWSNDSNKPTPSTL